MFIQQKFVQETLDIYQKQVLAQIVKLKELPVLIRVNEEILEDLGDDFEIYQEKNPDVFQSNEKYSAKEYYDGRKETAQKEIENCKVKMEEASRLITTFSKMHSEVEKLQGESPVDVSIYLS